VKQGLLDLEPLVVAGTGHRPSHKWWRGVGDWGTTWLHQLVQEWLGAQLDELQPAKVISGMAPGVDTWLALETLKRGGHLVCAIPFEGQHNRWPRESQELYHDILRRAAGVVNVSGCRVLSGMRSTLYTSPEYMLCPSGEQTPLDEPRGKELVRKLMQRRNVWMVDRARLMLSVWDGTPGGTGNCMDYVEQVGRQYRRLNPAELRKTPEARAREEAAHPLRGWTGRG
jgi:uncharacterized phage-like protein YoqJ